MTEKHEEYYAFLLYIRDSGICNMMEAPRLLSAEFGLSKKQARDIFISWTKTFNEDLNND